MGLLFLPVGYPSRGRPRHTSPTGDSPSRGSSLRSRVSRPSDRRSLMTMIMEIGGKRTAIRFETSVVLDS